MKRVIFLFAGISLWAGLAFGASPLKLWYDRPAGQWEETLPLGNGRLGMTPDGGVSREKIVLNDITLWSGAPQDANNYEASKYLPKIRALLMEGKNDEAQDLMGKDFICTGVGSASEPFGCFQTLGDLDIRYDYPQVQKDTIPYTDYTRMLLLDEAVAQCTYQVNGTVYSREYFTSFGKEDVDVIRIKASKKGMINCEIRINRPECATVEGDGTSLKMYGTLRSGTKDPGMQYLAMVKAKIKGGTLSMGEKCIRVEKATELLIYVSAGTNFRNDGYREMVRKNLELAYKTSYDKQKEIHVNRFQKWFNRVSLDLGAGENSNLATDKRLGAFYNAPGKDLALPALFYQFGRYLTICSTRVGLLPPNLQGLWANQIHTPWNGDYHLDVNVQMNHWPVEVSNLSELNLPLAELVKGMVKNGEKTAKAYYDAEGWVAHVITNVWGFTEPGESASWGSTKAGSGWLCNNLWEHYAFSGDLNYLRDIYPVLKGSAQFYSSMLIPDPKSGFLVTAPSSSPENSFYLPNGHSASVCMGPTIDNQIIRELFSNVIQASERLKVDPEFRKVLQERLGKIPPAGQISRDGRIMEWMEDYRETDPQHRHISHLYGLYPAPLITPEGTPDLAEAAKKTLDVRGDDGPSWTIAYKLLFWARLHDGNRSFKLLREILKPTLQTYINYGAGGGVYPNMLSAGPPFQIDGNFGAAAGIAEMLIQSHAGYIELLPSIPDLWKKSGKVEGLKARGNFTVGFSWKDGVVTDYSVKSPERQKVKIKVNGRIFEILSAKL